MEITISIFTKQVVGFSANCTVHEPRRIWAKYLDPKRAASGFNFQWKPPTAVTTSQERQRRLCPGAGGGMKKLAIGRKKKKDFLKEEALLGISWCVLACPLHPTRNATPRTVLEIKKGPDGVGPLGELLLTLFQMRNSETPMAGSGGDNAERFEGTKNVYASYGNGGRSFETSFTHVYCVRVRAQIERGIAFGIGFEKKDAGVKAASGHPYAEFNLHPPPTFMW
ncbi:hypothetical protein BJV78DRAFT_423784 [Lactifluus subvellereus]|nr:hypothetical protein BJV78DRAFT_423784 [Lactifluus subvellereus]